MAQSPRTRIMRLPRQEHEIHVFSNLLNSYDQTKFSSSLITPQSPQRDRDRLADYDYQAPLTSHSLRPNSKWLIVRRKLHRIRFMGFKDTGKEDRLPDFYLGIQMIRELKRAQEDIRNIDKEEDFHIVKEFSLAIDNGHTKKFDISHVKPDDALIYDRLGEEPLALQNLLYYFSKQDVPQGTVFWNFLNEVNHVLSLNHKRTLLVQRLKRLALSLAIIFYVFIGIMFFAMVISVITTTTKMNDPEVEWVDQRTEGYLGDVITLK